MTLGKIHFFFGNETFLVDEALQKCLSPHPSIDPVFFEGDIDIKSILNTSMSTGLFSSQQLIVIKNPSFFSKNPSKTDIDLWCDLFKKPVNPDTGIIIINHGSVDQRKKIASTLKKHASFQLFEPFKDWEQEKVSHWIKQRLQAANKRIDDDALILLQSICGMSLRTCANEIETLCVFLGEESHITLNHVKQFGSEAQSSIFDCLEGLKKRDYKTVFSSIQILKNSGEDPIKFIGLLSATFRLYLQILYLHSHRHSDAQIAKETGKHPFFVKQLLYSIKKHYSVDDVSSIMIQLAEFDVNIKSGKLKPAYVFSKFPSLIRA
ncbi:DNA polymerase III subunit delta [Candidatus Marinamargulisbacteria bacterium SCGC AG-343-D04]|nr:DNA polymerase III subunit delta [Candidatus Marinamargulisbacteria bacterium SCGC AG-343-D04]